MEEKYRLNEIKLSFEDLGFKSNEHPSRQEIKEAVKKYIKLNYGRYFKKGTFKEVLIKVKYRGLFSDPYVIISNIEFGRPLHKKEREDIENEK